MSPKAEPIKDVLKKSFNNMHNFFLILNEKQLWTNKKKRIWNSIEYGQNWPKNVFWRICKFWHIQANILWLNIVILYDMSIIINDEGLWAGRRKDRLLSSVRVYWGFGIEVYYRQKLFTSIIYTKTDKRLLCIMWNQLSRIRMAVEST